MIVELLLKIFENMIILSNAMSFFILAGLLIAGVLKQIVPDDYIVSHLGKNSIGSVIKATVFGIPMPVCSCSVIPLAKSLHKEGASKGAVQSFLISAPITGADSIMVTYSFFGWIFTIYRVITSSIMAVATGLLQNYITQKDKVVVTADTTCSGCCSSDTKKHNKNFNIKQTFYYAFVTLFEDIYLALLVGIVIGAVFTTLLPKEILAPLFEYQFLTYFAVLVISMPLYVCATASLPIAAAFLLSGISSGAVFVFLSAGPATNSVTMGVVSSMFGKKSFFLYLISISMISILFGYIFDTFFDKLELFDTTSEIENIGLLDTISTTVMFALIFYYIYKRIFR